MSRIKEQLTDYVQGKIQEIAEHSQCTKVVFSLSEAILAVMHLALYDFISHRGGVCRFNLHMPCETWAQS